MFQFINKLSRNEILTALLVTLVSGHIDKLSKSFTENIILPIIDIDIDGDGTMDGRKLIDYEITYANINFRVGKFFVTIIQFIIVLYIVSLLTEML